jgi:hypothetical protein
MWRVLLVAVAMALLALAGCSGLTPGGASESATNEGVYLPSAIIEGKTYGEWGDEWWKWAFSIPRASNPIVDLTGVFAGVGQSGPVWFLCGSFGTEVEWACTVPPGKAIFFPIVNGCGWYLEGGPTIEYIRTDMRSGFDRVIALEVTLDGRRLTGLKYYRTPSPATFVFHAPASEDDCVSPGQSGTHEAIQDGYYVMLEPMSPGRHDVYFRGKFVWTTTYPKVDAFETEATYHLTVE